MSGSLAGSYKFSSKTFCSFLTKDFFLYSIFRNQDLRMRRFPPDFAAGPGSHPARTSWRTVPDSAPPERTERPAGLDRRRPAGARRARWDGHSAAFAALRWSRMAASAGPEPDRFAASAARERRTAAPAGGTGPVRRRYVFSWA